MKNRDYWRLTLNGKQHLIANLQVSDFVRICQETNPPPYLEVREVLKGKVYVAYTLHIVGEDDLKMRVWAKASRHDVCLNVSDFLDEHQGALEGLKRATWTPADQLFDPPITIGGSPRPTDLDAPPGLSARVG